MKKVITCVDQNVLAPAVRDYGIYVAKTLGAELVFIHVVEIPELGENFYGLAAGGNGSVFNVAITARKVQLVRAESCACCWRIGLYGITLI